MYARAGYGPRRWWKAPASFGIDFLDAFAGDLKQVLAVESRSGLRGDFERLFDVSRQRDR